LLLIDPNPVVQGVHQLTESTNSRLTPVPGKAADVYDQDFAVVPSELGTVAADGDVIEEDVAARVPAGGCDGLIEQEP
jgi:hypothetical protein